jgi:hypothetical protein
MHTQSMKRRSGNTEVIRTYTIAEQLSVRLTEIPRRRQFPTCACCGDGNYWHVTCHRRLLAYLGRQPASAPWRASRCW